MAALLNTGVSTLFSSGSKGGPICSTFVFFLQHLGHLAGKRITSLKFPFRDSSATHQFSWGWTRAVSSDSGEVAEKDQKTGATGFAAYTTLSSLATVGTPLSPGWTTCVHGPTLPWFCLLPSFSLSPDRCTVLFLTPQATVAEISVCQNGTSAPPPVPKDCSCSP